MLYRNWGEISKVECGVTRTALFSCTDAKVVAMLRKGFPTCFSDSPPVPVPWEQLLDRAVAIRLREQWKQRQWDSRCPDLSKAEIRVTAQWYLLPACEHFQIPLVTVLNMVDHRERLKRIENELFKKQIQQPLYVEYEGEASMVAGISFWDSPRIAMSEVEAWMQKTGKTPTLQWLCLIPASAVIFGSLEKEE